MVLREWGWSGLTEKLSKRENEDGLVWIEGQKVFVRDHRGTGIPPTIVPTEDTTLVIDGEIYNHITIVSSKNIINVETKESIREPSIKVSISEDELEAYIVFEPGIRRKLRLKNQEPKNSITLETESTEIHRFNTLTKEQIYKELSDAGVVYGIDDGVIEAILKADEEQKYVVARGIKPVPGKDADVKLFFDENSIKRELTENEHGIVDYKKLLVFNNVGEGEVIAVKHPCTEGKDGVNVKGQVVPCPKPKDITLIAGSGVIIEDDGLTAKAATAGLPKRKMGEGAVTLEICKILEFNHDIDLTTGNINYAHDVVINGNVNESMEVNSFGSVYIKGNVSFARVSALKGIAVEGNVISSKLFCGLEHLAGTSLVKVLTGIYNNINSIIQNVENLMQNPSFETKDIKVDGIGVLLKPLINMKFKDLPFEVFSLFVNARKEQYGIFNDVAFEAYEALKVFLGNYSAMKALDEIIEIREAVKRSIGKCTVEAGESKVIIKYALNSEILSDGSVRITGKGCHNTKICSKGEVIVSGNFIGGEIMSKKSVKLSQVGSDIGATSVIETDAGYSISANRILEGNIVKIGGKAYKFKSTEYSVNIKLIGNELVNNKTVLR